MKIVSKSNTSSLKEVRSTTILDLLLKTRGIDNSEDFMKPADPTKLRLKDFGKEYISKSEKVIRLLKKIKKENGMIVVYTDYDADGITGGAILWETLHLLGFRAMPYVPDRKTEGYGFSIKGIDRIKKEFNPALIISVDHGITAREKIAYAKKVGIPVIVTDHHLKPEKLPTAAVAIFHIPALSGSGVSYYFSKELYEEFKSDSSQKKLLEHNFNNDYLALASIGTIADLVPLVGPSRNLVFHGLDACSHTKRHGLMEILRQARIIGKKITPYEVGFMIAPRINAVGRLRHAIDALRLLCTTDSKRAIELAGKMGDMNRERQDLVKISVAEAKEIIKKIRRLPKIITLVSQDWNEGIIGLIAGKVAEEYNRPAIVMTQSDGILKGSARSPGSFHITNFLRSLKKYLVDVGGHQGAGGFTIEKKHLKAFLAQVEKRGNKEVREKDLEKIITADIQMPLSAATDTLAHALEKLQPFGVGNTQPLFLSDAELIDAKLFGKNSEHLKLYVKDPESRSFPLELIAFSKADLFKTLSTGMKLQIVYALEVDRWGGSEKLRGRAIHLK